MFSFQEAKSIKEEFILQENSTSLKLRKQEAEISRLRSQLSAALTPSSEVESRLATLTQTLVLKQQALESLTTERNALRLQLEKIEVLLWKKLLLINFHFIYYFYYD